MTTNTEDIANFNLWVVAPFDKLRELPNGDGAFAVLSIAFTLYERYLISKLDAANDDKSPQKRYELASQDFDSKVSPSDFQSFWEMYRVGIQHCFQPKNFTKEKDKTRWGWDISENKGYKKYPAIEQKESDLFIITIDPWTFKDQVLQRWRETPELINYLQTFAFGQITTLPQMPLQPLSEQLHHTQHQNNEDSSISNNPLPPATGIYPEGMNY